MGNIVKYTAQLYCVCYLKHRLSTWNATAVELKRKPLSELCDHSKTQLYHSSIL